jgi:hypothetical protein
VKRSVALLLLETALLLLALFFTLPAVPSNDESIQLFPAIVFAALCFAGSRALRWKGKWVLWSLEVLAFLVFAYASNATDNLLLSGASNRS